MTDSAYEVFEDEEVLELREIDVESIGLVPSGANQRRYVVTKGGDKVMDAATIAKAIMEDEHFWDKLADAFSDADVEKQGKEDARRKMAMRILGANTVEEAIRALGGQAKATSDEENPDEQKAAPDEENPKEDKAPEEEKPEEKANPDDQKKPDEEKPDEKKAAPDPYEEKYPKPSAKSEYAEIFAAMQKRIDASEAMAQSALSQLLAAKKEARRQELMQQAEGFAALPEVKPQEFANVLFNLEQTSPELFADIVKVLGPAADALTEIYGERGTQKSDGTGNAFLTQVEARTRDLQKAGTMTYEEAYSEAYLQVADEKPKLAQAYLDLDR